MHFSPPIECHEPWCRTVEAMLRHGPVTLEMIGGKVRFTGHVLGDVASGTGDTIWAAIQDAYEAQSEGRE
jgi:hypothetical protein